MFSGILLTLSGIGLVSTGCNGTEVENHTNYDVPFPDTFPPMVSPHELSANDTIPVPELPGNFTEEEAMELIYGLYDRNIECSKWVCTVQERPSFEGKMSESGHLFSRSAGFYPFRNGTGIGVYLITETLQRTKEGWEDCHACAPILGAAEFTHADNKWIVKSLKKDLGELGAWGALPTGQLIKIGQDHFGILFEGGFTNQGISVNTQSILAVADGQFEIVHNAETGFSNEGFFSEGMDAAGAYAYDSKVRFEEGENGEFFDLIIQTEGTRPMDGSESGQILPFKEVRKYVFEAGKYALRDSSVTLTR